MLALTMPTSIEGPDRKLTTLAAANLLQVSERTLARWADRLDLPHDRVGNETFFSREALLGWADQHSLRLSADVSSDEDRDEALPTLASAIERGGIHRGIDGDSIDAALEAAAMAMQLPDEIDRTVFHQVLLAREDLDSTGIGGGVAVPHVRAPLVMHVELAHVALAFLDRPIDWHAIDGKPVDTLFLLVCPGIRSHLHLLRRIAWSLRDETLRDMLIARAESGAILEQLRGLE